MKHKNLKNFWAIGKNSKLPGTSGLICNPAEKELAVTNGYLMAVHQVDSDSDNKPFLIPSDMAEIISSVKGNLSGITLTGSSLILYDIGKFKPAKTGTPRPYKQICAKFNIGDSGVFKLTRSQFDLWPKPTKKTKELKVCCLERGIQLSDEPCDLMYAFNVLWPGLNWLFEEHDVTSVELEISPTNLTRIKHEGSQVYCIPTT